LLAAGFKIRQQYRQGFPDDPAAVGGYPVSAQRHLRLLELKQLAARQIHGNFMAMTLPAAGLTQISVELAGVDWTGGGRAKQFGNAGYLYPALT
jgi:hypothetical protein